MQTPYRKPGKYMSQKPDPSITLAKFDALQSKLKKLQDVRPQAAAEVSRLAELGDFSENMEYQLAKGRLRGINNKILEIEYALKNAEIIYVDKNKNTAQVGHTVTIKNQNSTRTFQILGSAEADPLKNIISQNSPLGAALLGKSVGEIVRVEIKNKVMTYEIVKIE